MVLLYVLQCGVMPNRVGEGPVTDVVDCRKGVLNLRTFIPGGPYAVVVIGEKLSCAISAIHYVPSIRILLRDVASLGELGTHSLGIPFTFWRSC